MLLNLHVKNLAIIDEVEVDFREGFHVLTGETGAGKSIIIGSISAGLGGRVSKDMVRKGAESALIELLFSVDTAAQRDMMRELGLEEEEEILISRKLTGGRSINRINGETVTLQALRKMASVLVDIHGQNEQQSLLNREVHRRIVDRYAKSAFDGSDEKLKTVYQKYRSLVAQKAQSGEITEEERLREISFMQYELQEIEDAGMRTGEEEELATEHRRLSNMANIVSGLGEVYGILGSAASDNVGEKLGHCLRILNRLSDYDEEVGEFAGQLSEIDDLVTGVARDMESYMERVDNQEERLFAVTERLDLVRRIKAKYGSNCEQVEHYAQNLREKLQKYEEYEEYRKRLGQEIEQQEEILKKLCADVTRSRKKCAKILQEEITSALVDLNFLQVRFEIAVRPLNDYTEHGLDEVEFLISVNPGEDLKSLEAAASGGEISRIMLAVKAVLAEHDEISTLIFDEIDVGISGRTAQKVAEKMALIGQTHQVICISHLAQIAAMADVQYLIEKSSGDGHTATQIRMLSGEEEVEELARILGGAKITDAVIQSAREMKELANAAKKI